MLTGLMLAMWIGVTGSGVDARMNGVDPLESYDYPAYSACAVNILCGPGIPFTEFTTEVADFLTAAGTDFTIGAKQYGITGLPNGGLSWNGSQFSYVTNGVGEWAHTWTTTDPLHFLFLRTVDNRFFVAIEDLPTYVTDGDYNDAIYELNVLHTPEPGSLLLLGSGLAMVARLARRRPA